MKKALILSDNEALLRSAIQSCERQRLEGVDFVCSPRTTAGCEALVVAGSIRKCRINEEQDTLIGRYDLLVSLHCRQVFSAKLVNSVRCVNFHPGLNPNNRGWFPHVFSMVNGRPAGVTIHEMDAQIDHGPIIYQEPLEISLHEISADVYTRIIEREKLIFGHWIKPLLLGDYTTSLPDGEGNYNSRSDFESLKEIRLDVSRTAGEMINYLRAMTFPGYQNAFFRDEHTGKRYYVTIKIEPEDAK